MASGELFNIHLYGFFFFSWKRPLFKRRILVVSWKQGKNRLILQFKYYHKREPRSMHCALSSGTLRSYREKRQVSILAYMHVQRIKHFKINSPKSNYLRSNYSVKIKMSVTCKLNWPSCFKNMKTIQDIHKTNIILREYDKQDSCCSWSRGLRDDNILLSAFSGWLCSYHLPIIFLP